MDTFLFDQELAFKKLLWNFFDLLGNQQIEECI